MNDEVSAFSAIVRGKVQGVGFRYSCLNKAQSLGLCGWVKNSSDGSVEVWSEGPASAQEQFLAWLHKGPPYARVNQVLSNPQTPSGRYHEFFIQY